ncbi:MAG TPA: radical SAM protein [Pyrinomonadaceae bacterium]|nr:radical SAM protein [Pyrinomonadaceae bacterium]
MKFDQLEDLASAYDIPLLDVQLMALNLFGIASNIGDGRARVEVRLLADPENEWHLIVPTGRETSPYKLSGDELLLSGVGIASVRLVEHDDAHLGYVRVGGQVLTLNTNRRSICTGCVFCPNTLADANDPRIANSDDELEQWLRAFLQKNHWADLSKLNEINLSTGCFGEESRALEHLRDLRGLLKKYGFTDRLGILSSVIRSSCGLRVLSELEPFALFLTLECITRRKLLLKESKANLDPQQAIRILQRARAVGVETGVMIVVGLDPLRDAINWLREAAPYLTDFPNLQIFQSHSPYMDIFRTDGAEQLEFFLQARRELESMLLPTPLRPRRWQNYRPLWHYKFGAESLPL